MASFTVRRVAVILVLGNLVAVALHLAEVRAGPLGPDGFPSGRLRINRDQGLAEVWGYLQTSVAVALLVVVFAKKQNALALAWAAVLTLVVLDDSLGLHERLGSRAGRALQLPSPGGLRPSDLGELLAWGLMGVVAVAALLLGWRASTHRQRSATGPLFGSFIALVFFAIVVDLVHQAVSSDNRQIWGIELNPAVRFAEASGELFSMTAIALAALALVLDMRPDHTRDAIRNIDIRR